MDFAVHDHKDERTTAVLTSLVDIINHISNHLGSPIDFNAKPITKKPTSKKVDVGGKMETDKTSLGNKSIPGMAISQTKPKVIKANPYNNTSKDFTGSLVVKGEDDDWGPDTKPWDDFSENTETLPIMERAPIPKKSNKKFLGGEKLPSDDTEKLWPLFTAGETGALAGAAVKDSLKPEDDEKKSMSSLSTSEGKKLVSTLQDAAEALSKFLNTTRVPNTAALTPNDMRRE